MVFSNHLGVLRVSRITGPTHNLLGLRFSSGQWDAPPQMIDLDRDDAPMRLQAADIRRAVQSGVEEINRSLHTSYRVDRIEFLHGDSPPVDVYRLLAIAIIERLASAGEFRTSVQSS